MQKWRIAPCAVAALTLLCLGGTASGPPAASAHYRAAHNNWYFYGTVYHDSKLVKNRSKNDPLSIYFGGGQWKGSGQAACEFGYTASPGCVVTEVNVDWSQMINDSGVCNTNAYVVYRDLHGGRQFVSRAVALKTDPNGCGTEYHIRFWSDHAHASQTGYPNDQFTLGAIHHEHRGSDLGHIIDKPWDDVRVHAVKKMRQACTYRHWHVHPGAVGKFQGFSNSGVISRISLQQRADTCSGA
jgi:hypothetical protein